MLISFPQISLFGVDHLGWNVGSWQNVNKGGHLETGLTLGRKIGPRVSMGLTQSKFLWAGTKYPGNGRRMVDLANV